MVGVNGDQARRRHILGELGFTIRRVGDELRGTASITPEMHVPGTRRLRTSVLAARADHLAGILTAGTMTPRAPVTLELDVHLYRPAPAAGVVRGVDRTVRTGRTVFVAAVGRTGGAVPGSGRHAGSLGLRYLQAVRAGPAVATARPHSGLGQVELHDSGDDHRPAVTATARTFGGR